MTAKAILIPLLVSLGTAVKQDLDTYITARKRDGNVRFDWPLALARYGQSVLMALLGIAVGSAVPGQ